MSRLPLILTLTLLLASHVFGQNKLRIAAAADLQPLLPSLLSGFQNQTGIAVQASYKSSATLATQIISGAPFDLFLAADLAFPRRVIQAGKAEETQPIPYARGTLVLWTRYDSGVRDLSLPGLRNPHIHSIAIANPQHAPYGHAAEETLQHAGLFPSLQMRLVVAENIAQAAQYADSGNAQVGFISLTSALTPRLRTDGHYLAVPASDYSPLLQGAVVVRGSPNTAAAHRFLEYLHSSAVAQLMANGGLQPVSPSTR